MVVRGCLFCHRFAENLVTTHFPICPFYVAYISYAVCQGPWLSKNQRLYKSTICILLFQSLQMHLHNQKTVAHILLKITRDEQGCIEILVCFGEILVKFLSPAGS